MLKVTKNKGKNSIVMMGALPRKSGTHSPSLSKNNVV
jgi:hypothetical protein